MRNGHAKKESYLLPLSIEEMEDGRFLARSPKLRGLNVVGDSIEDVVKLAPKVAKALLAAMKSKGVPTPRGLVITGSPIKVQILVGS